MTQFSFGIELGNLVVSSDLLQHSWAKILELYGDNNIQTASTSPLKCKAYQHGVYGTIVAFVPSRTCTVQDLEGEGRGELISSATLKRENFPWFEFLSTKTNQAFSIHKAAILIFQSLYGKLSELKTQLDITKPLIITGHSIGGSIASLFTLWLLGSSRKATRRPLCITFGSPLIGDNGFQQAILERPIWTSCFLHVASNMDPIPKLFVSGPLRYQPFGTFLLCSEYGCACFEEPESVSELLLVAMRSDNVGTQDPCDYTSYLKWKAICKGSSGLSTEPLSTLRGGIITQLEAIGVRNSLQQRGSSDDINTLITNVEERTKNLIFEKRNAFNPNKKLNDRKIDMAYCEWYKKSSTGNRGYYDSYKNVFDQSQATIVKHHRKLTRYWMDMVAEAEKMPQEEGASFRTRWLYSGTNYRRMVEPFDIADYYRKGKRDYQNQGRSQHYVLLEQWLNDDKPKMHGNDANERKAACSLTEDSCFWAHVEEAILSCKLLNARETSQEDNESSREKLNQFERYAMVLINNFGVSTEIFLEHSSFMQWWVEYDKKIGDSHNSELKDFMRSHKYRQYK